MESMTTHEPPGFLFVEHSTLSTEIFKPIPVSRRGEFLAWSGTLFVGAVGVYVLWKTKGISLFTPAIFFMLLMVASIISFGNWVDRRTSIRISSEMVFYRSPIRKVELGLNAIESLWAVPAGRGWRILVRGEGQLFHFRTGIHLESRSGAEMHTGIEGGERLAGIIRHGAGLSALEHEDGVWVCRRV